VGWCSSDPRACGRYRAGYADEESSSADSRATRSDRRFKQGPDCNEFDKLDKFGATHAKADNVSRLTAIAGKLVLERARDTVDFKASFIYFCQFCVANAARDSSSGCCLARHWCIRPERCVAPIGYARWCVEVLGHHLLGRCPEGGPE